MKTYKVTFYDYFNPRTTRQVLIVQAKTKANASGIVTQLMMPSIGTAIVITSVREVQS